LTVIAMPVAVAGCSVEEVLLHAAAFVGGEFGGCAPQCAGRVVAGVGIVTAQDGAEDGAALEITACALAAGAGESRGVSAGAALAIGDELIGGTRAGCSRADFGDIAGASAGAAGCVCGFELAAGTACFVGIVADCVVFEFARGRVAAGVVAAACRSSAIAILAAFYNTVAALAAGIGDDVFVVYQTVGLDAVSAYS
jgi:hypothetical protein